MAEDFADLLEALKSARARYLVVGGYAVGVHGRPRATKDLDIWVEATPRNAKRVLAALQAFGAPTAGIDEQTFATVGPGFIMGHPPVRIDILTEISGVSFAEAWPRRIDAAFGRTGVRAHVIGLAHLLQNKRAARRPQDLVDVETLTQLAALRRRKSK